MPGIHVRVTVEGEDVSAMLTHVEVEESDLRSDLATLSFLDSSLLLPDVLHEGLAVEIDLGSEDAHGVVFRGVITGLRSHFAEKGPARVVVEATDPLITLGLLPRTKRWWNTTLSGIVRDIALANGLQPGRVTPAVNPAFQESRPVRQVEETDLALLHRLAADYDCKVSVAPSGRVNRLDFEATDGLLTAEPLPGELEYQRNLVDFTAEFDAFATNPAGRLVTTHPRTGERTEDAATLVTVADTAWVPDPERVAALGKGAEWAARLITKGIPVRAKLLDQWRRRERDAGAASGRALAAGDRARRLGQTARGLAVGNVTLRPRRRVKVVGCGGRWSGTWYLATVRHEVDVGIRTYTTSFLAKR